MATESFTKQARRALYAFANKVASRVSDSRRRRFVREMVTGIVIANHVHLTRIARAVGKGDNKVHAHEKRLSRNLDSPHWNMQPMVDGLMQQSATMVDDDSLIVADLTDVSKYYARKMEGLGKVRDASDPDKRFAPGYMLFEAYVRVRRWQLFPLVIEPLKTYAGAPTSENEEILGHLLRIHRQTGGRGTWVMDRGADRQELMVPLMRHRVAFVIRQRGDRLVTTPGGRTLLMQELAGELFVKAETWPWPRKGLVVCCPVRLPQAPQHELLLVAYWRTAGSAPLLLLVSPAARAAGRNGFWFVRAYLRRWGVEDATRGIKQRFHLEQFLVRSWRSIRRLICLVAISFFWLNLWGEPRFDSLRNALLGHPWRIPKEVTFLFNWIASQIREILHPRPKLTIDTG